MREREVLTHYDADVMWGCVDPLAAVLIKLVVALGFGVLVMWSRSW